MDPPPPYIPNSTRPPLSAQDFETASIRSAAPSYRSAIPSYPSPSTPSSLPSPFQSSSPRSSEPSLAQFRRRASDQIFASSSPLHHSVAHRRASALTAQSQAQVLSAAYSPASLAELKRRQDQEEKQKAIRTMEDPYLVGEEAAKENKEERLRRENGWGVLEREDKRWDWLLAQMSDWEERDRSWKQFRKEMEGGRRAMLAKRLGFGG